jgi:DNA-binding response OmpR family regulator
VLLVEDEDILRKILARSLQASGFRVIEAASGEVALELLANREGPIDLLVTDVVMDQVSGREVAEAFAAACPGASVVVMSGYTDDAELKRGIEAGTAFLQKPFRPETLVAKARELTDGAEAQAPSPAAS